MTANLVVLNLRTAQLEIHFVMDTRPYSAKLMKLLGDDDYEYLGRL